jgi:nitrogen-specific signal transduction histidine kinase
LFLLACRSWPNALDERRAVYKEFITELANISYSNLKRFLMFEGNKAGNLPTVNYHDVLEKVTETSKTIMKSKCYIILPSVSHGCDIMCLTLMQNSD